MKNPIIKGMTIWHDKKAEKYREEGKEFEQDIDIIMDLNRNWSKRLTHLANDWMAKGKKIAKNCTIILVVNSDAFIELANSIKISLDSLGIETDIIDNKDFKPIRPLTRRDMYIVIKAFRPFNERILGDDSIKILYQPEECWNRRESGYYDLSRGYDRVLELYHENVKIPRGTWNVVHCPLGYSQAYETDLEPVEESIDVLFFGSMTDRRKRFTEELNKHYNAKFLTSTFGRERDEFIMKSKININIKAYDNWSYGPLHCLLIQGKRKFTLSEKGNGGYEPFIAGKHFKEYNGLDDLRRKIDYWLEHEEERKIFGVEAYNDIKKNYNFTQYIKNALGGMI